MNQLRVGDVISRSVSILLANFFSFMLLTGLVYIPIIFMAVDVASGGVDQAHAMHYIVGGGFLSTVLHLLASAAVLYGVLQEMRGKHASAGACIEIGFKRLLPVLCVSVLTTLAVFLGVILFIIPGIILYTMFCVAVPVAVVEQPGIVESLTRSKELTDGHKGSIFAISMVLVLIAFSISLVTGFLRVALGSGGLIIDIIANVLIGALSAVVMVVIYHDLRAFKEGVGAHDLVREIE
ncbi:MAG: hypothetical protein MJE77_45080 [Proteobacteria bacterium]|nr:hypothetical protein [Pseudomonadota bacterium]